MTARQTIYTTLGKLRQQSKQTGQVRLPAPALALAIRAGVHLLLAAVLAGTVILEDSAPFGVALVGAAGPGLMGGAALVGACFGSLTVLPFSDGLRYAAAAILTFAVGFAFYDGKLLRRPWTMPAVAVLVNGFTGAIVRSRQGWTPTEFVSFTLELVLTGAAVLAFRRALAPSGEAPIRRVGLLALACALLAALSPVYLYREISLGRILAGLVVAACAHQAGAATGAVVGVCAGLSMDLAVHGSPVYATTYSLAGLVAGLCRGKNRLRAALFYGTVAAGLAMWLWDGEAAIPLLYETCLTLAAFLLAPEPSMRRLGAWLAAGEALPADRQAQRLARRRLEYTAQAFSSLCDALRSAFRPPENNNDIASVFDRTASRLCRGCALRDRCWQRDYNVTFNALNDATPAMVERGKAVGSDFPGHFANRCIHFTELLATINEELAALFYRRQYNARIRESRAAVCQQYAQLSELLGEAAAELGRELTPDPVSDRRLRQRLAELGLEVRTAAYRDSRGLLRVEADGPDARELARPSRVTDLGLALGIPLRVEEEGEDGISLLQQEPLMAVAGVAAQKKTGETVSGDAGTYFKRPDGQLYLLLCDGMGSGPEANRESSLAVRLLEQLLQAGVSTRHALTTLSSALALRGEETGGFTTVDLLQLDLFSGAGELYKLGAAPTYVKKGGQVQRLSGQSLPAGLAEGDALDHFSLRLAPGDCVLMVSDGICGTGDDSWLKEKLTAFDGASPKDLARELITASPHTATDDRTALVVRIDKRT